MYNLAGKDTDVLVLFVFQVNNSQGYLQKSNDESIAIDKITVFEKNGTPEINRVWSSTIDHVAFWRNYDAADVLAVAVGEKATDFQTILLFKKSNPSKPKKFTPTAMTIMNIVPSNNEMGDLYNFICYDAKKNNIVAERLNLLNMKNENIDIVEYISVATNSRCKITSDGMIELQGFGLNGKNIRHSIPLSFVSENFIAETNWYIVENTPSSLLLQRNIDSSFELICLDNGKDFSLFKCPIGSQRIIRNGKKIIVSSVENLGWTNGLHYIIDVKDKTISTLLLPPMAKILFLDDKIIAVSLLEHIRIYKLEGSKNNFVDIPYKNAFNAQTAWLQHGK
jgi:hypothetical protein